jgi:ABC-type antimicrobial peptide transport system permease subunit
VSQRTQEIGVRMALGAPPRQVMRLVSREGMTIALIGLSIGTIGALITTRVLRTLHFGVSATDPSVFVLVWAVVSAVALLAVYLPARRATRVDPLVALRTE